MNDLKTLLLGTMLKIRLSRDDQDLVVHAWNDESAIACIVEATIHQLEISQTVLIIAPDTIEEHMSEELKIFKDLSW